MTDRPFPGGADAPGGPTPGYYADPSIPGFVRYWGGTTWVPGTSRPAPVEGELLEPPRFTPRQAASQAAAAPYGPSVAPSIVPPVVPPPGVGVGMGGGGGAAETGPMYFDQTTGGVSFTIGPQPSGESAEIELRPRADVEAHRTAEDATGAPRLEPVPDPFPGSAPGPFPGAAQGSSAGPLPGSAPGPFVGSAQASFAGSLPGQVPGPFVGSAPGPLPGAAQGSFAGSLPESFPGAAPGVLSGSAPPADPVPSRGSGWRADPSAQPGLLDTGGALQPVSWGVPCPAAVADPVAEIPPEPATAAQASAAQRPGAPEAAAPPARARESAAVASAALPVQASARTRKAAAKPSIEVAPAAPASVLPPAGLGARLCARLLDGLVVAVVGVAAGVPLAATALRHLQEKLDQARMAAALTGRQTQVWLVDPVVLGNAAALLAVLALLGFLCEVLPTARTGQTFGKRLMRIRVVDAVERAGRKSTASPSTPSTPSTPSLGRSTVRWLVGQLALVLVVGPLWPLLDRRSRRGWQDRAARTRVVRAERG